MKPPVKVVAASDGMEISIHFPTGNAMAANLQRQAERLNREPAFLVVDMIEAVLGKGTETDLIGVVLATHFLLVKRPRPLSKALLEVSDAYARRERELESVAA